MLNHVEFQDASAAPRGVPFSAVVALSSAAIRNGPESVPEQPGQAAIAVLLLRTEKSGRAGVDATSASGIAVKQ